MHAATPETIATAQAEVDRIQSAMNAVPETELDGDLFRSLCRQFGEIEGWLYVAKTRGETRRPLSVALQQCARIQGGV